MILYPMYTKYKVIMMHPSPSTQVAMSVDHESYALIFGFNYFMALVLQTILTLIVADEHGLNLDIRTQVTNILCCA